MALFSKQDLDKPKYIDAIINDIKSKKPISVKNNGETYDIVFDYTDIIKEIELNKNNSSYYKKLIYPDEKYTKVFKSGSTSFQFNNIDKSQYSKMGSSLSANSLGKALADAAEKTTIKSIEYHIHGKKILTPECTNEKVFIMNPDLFTPWKNTFDKTPLIVDDITKSNLNQYQFIHDASRDHPLEGIIKHISNLKGCSKDSWNPADMWVVKNNSLEDIKKEFTSIFNYNMIDKDKLTHSNNLIKDLYVNDYLYPVSLKQIVGEGQYEETNLHQVQYNYNFEMTRIPCDFKVDENDNFITKEIGVFSALNKITNKTMTFQIRGFPHGYGVAQTEITSSGDPTGGRVGKIPAFVIDQIFEKFNHKRIKSINEFKNFNLTQEDKQKFIDMYENVANDMVLRYNIDTWINKTLFDLEFKNCLCIKLQGLVMANFLKSNENNINEILTAFLLGAKKISQDSGFFIKIY